MKTEEIELKRLVENEDNPRQITEENFAKLVKSIVVFPKMLDIRPVVTDGAYKVLGGNMRTRALAAIQKMDATEIREKLDEERMKDKRLVLSFKFGLAEYSAPWCMANWSVITVDVDGNVPYCCHRPKEILGNVMDLNIMQKKMEYHVDMKKCEKPCRLSGANKYMEELKKDEEWFFV